MNLRHVLVAIDGSREGQCALDVALRLALPHRPKFILTSVVPDPPGKGRHPDVAGPLARRLKADAKSYLAEAHAATQRLGLDAQVVLLEGPPAQEICDLVASERPDVVAVGNRGLSDQKIHLIGSVSYNVAHFAKAPVLVVRRERPLRRILLPIDGTEVCKRTTEWAAALAKAHWASVTVMYVIPQGTEEVKFTVTRAIAYPFIGPTVDLLKAQGIDVDTRIEYGHPAEMIMRVTHLEGSDLVVLGRVGRASAAGFGLGGVTDKILHHAPTDVLVVP